MTATNKWRLRRRMAWTRLKDAIRYSVMSYRIFSWLNALVALITRDERARIEKWIKAYRFDLFGSRTRGLARRNLAHWTRGAGLKTWRQLEIGWSRFEGFQSEGHVTRTVVAKAPLPDGEKGVLLSSFEYNCFKLLRDPEIAARLESRYDMIFATTSSPADYATLGLALSSLKGDIRLMASHPREIEHLAAFHPRIKCLSMLPCDWVNPSAYDPLPRAQRSIDILMVAGWGPVKRHWHFFEALKECPSDLRVVLVGQQDRSYDRAHIEKLARDCGVPQRLEIHQSLPKEEVTALQCDSRTSVIFSRREGSCFAVTEALMADTPVALLEGAHIGSSVHINEQTGAFLPLRRTGSALREFVDRADSFHPRSWAVENLGNKVMTETLNTFMKASRAERGEAWTGSIEAMAFDPHPMIVGHEAKARVAPAFEELHREFPQLFSSDLIDTSRL